MEFPKASITANEILRKNSNFGIGTVQRSISNEGFEAKSSNTSKNVLIHFPIAFYKELSHFTIGFSKVLSHSRIGFYKVLSHSPIGFSKVLSHSPIGYFQCTES